MGVRVPLRATFFASQKNCEESEPRYWFAWGREVSSPACEPGLSGRDSLLHATKGVPLHLNRGFADLECSGLPLLSYAPTRRRAVKPLHSKFDDCCSSALAGLLTQNNRPDPKKKQKLWKRRPCLTLLITDSLHSNDHSADRKGFAQQKDHRRNPRLHKAGK